MIAQRSVDAWVLCLPEKEEFPHSVFLLLDWRFRGAIARALLSGGISRHSGETSLLPCTRPIADLGMETFRILTVGVRERKSVATAELSHLHRNIKGLGLKRYGVSASDFGWSVTEAKKHFAGTDAWITE